VGSPFSAGDARFALKKMTAMISLRFNDAPEAHD
jgi:hypothetical protein